MSLIPSNIRCHAFGIQPDKDTPADTPVIAIALESTSLDPNVQSLTTAESDRSAQQGQRIIVGAQPGGAFRKYVRPSEEDFFLAALLGLFGDAGSAPTTHTSNIDASAPFFSPYLTVWDIWPGVLSVMHTGCRIAQAVISSAPGQAFDAEYTVAGLKSVYLDDEPDLDGLFIDELPHVWPELTANIEGITDGTLNALSLTINRNTGRFPGDVGLADYDVPNGLVAVTGNATVAFEDDDLTRLANTGDAAGTELSTLIAEKSLAFVLARGADLGVEFDIAAAQITNVQTALNTDASPAVTTFDFQSKRQDDITDVITAIIKNAITTSDRS